MHSPREDQLASLAWHVGLSNETGKPLVVHVREAWEDVLRLLADERAERVVIHCFSGDAAIAKACTDRGYWLSFAANVTYPKNPELREAAAAAPEDRLVVETDSPFLPPGGAPGQGERPRPRVGGGAGGGGRTGGRSGRFRRPSSRTTRAGRSRSRNPVQGDFRPVYPRITGERKRRVSAVRAPGRRRGLPGTLALQSRGRMLRRGLGLVLVAGRAGRRRAFHVPGQARHCSSSTGGSSASRRCRSRSASCSLAAGSPSAPTTRSGPASAPGTAACASWRTARRC